MQSSGAKRMRAGFAVLRREANEGGFFRPIVKEVVERYLDCGNPRCGFGRIRCPDCGEERFVAEYEGLVVASWANYSNRGKGDMKKRYYGLLGVAWWRIPKRQEDKVRD